MGTTNGDCREFFLVKFSFFLFFHSLIYQFILYLFLVTIPFAFIVIINNILCISNLLFIYIIYL